ncbi:hypothetical protein [Lentilactobacillus hilgardii]
MVFPELSTTGYECGTGVYQLAETATGQSVQYMQMLQSGTAFI